MMTINQPDQLEVVAVMLVDIRATVDAQKRAVANAQASIEQFRHTRGTALLDDVAACLEQVANDARAVIEAAADAHPILDAIASGLPAAVSPAHGEH